MSGTVIHYHCPRRACNIAELTREQADQFQGVCPNCECDLVDADAGVVTLDSPKEHQQVLEREEALRQLRPERLQQEAVAATAATAATAANGTN